MLREQHASGFSKLYDGHCRMGDRWNGTVDSES